MTRTQRRVHLLVWLVLGAGLLAVIVALRPAVKEHGEQALVPDRTEVAP